LIAEFQITIATIPADKPAFTIATIAQLQITIVFAFLLTANKPARECHFIHCYHSC